MTVESLKRISEISLDLVCTEALIMGGFHLKKKMMDTKLLCSNVVPLDFKINTGNLNLISLMVLL